MTAAPARRTLKFNSCADALAEIRLLRRGYAKSGKWTLPQMGTHLSELMELMKDEPPADDLALTEKQAASQAHFLEPLLAGGPMPQGGQNNPPADAGDDQIDRLQANFAKLDACPNDHVTSDALGPMPLEKWRRLHLLHAAHHLGFLVPTSK